MPEVQMFSRGVSAQPWRWTVVAALGLIGCLIVLALGPNAAAQQDGAEPAPQTQQAVQQAQGAEQASGAAVSMGEGVPTVAALFMTSPYVNSILAVLSVLAVLLFLYLLLSLDRGSFSPPQFVDEVTKLIINRQFDQAVHLCQNNGRVFASSIIQRVIENRDKGPDVLMDILSAEGQRRSERIWNRTGYLAEIANIAPMIGLLGTVIGMIKVFFTLTTRTVGEKAAQLSAGIAEAMGTTMFGLIVAIAAGMFYTIIKGRATAALTNAEHVCHTIVDHTYRASRPERGDDSRRRGRGGSRRSNRNRPDKKPRAGGGNGGKGSDPEKPSRPPADRDPE